MLSGTCKTCTLTCAAQLAWKHLLGNAPEACLSIRCVHACVQSTLVYLSKRACFHDESNEASVSASILSIHCDWLQVMMAMGAQWNKSRFGGGVQCVLCSRSPWHDTLDTDTLYHINRWRLLEARDRWRQLWNSFILFRERWESAAGRAFNMKYVPTSSRLQFPNGTAAVMEVMTRRD